MKIRIPRTKDAALALLVRVAELDTVIAGREARRVAARARIDAAADAIVAPAAEERAAIVAALEPWWTANRAELAGKRKSIDLGGCTIGTKASAPALDAPADIDAAVETLRTHRWAKPLVRVSYAADRKAILAALDGARGNDLRGMGFAVRPAADAFFVKPA